MRVDGDPAINAVWLSMDLSGDTARITVTSLLAGTCEFAGTLVGDRFPLSGSGTFECPGMVPSAGDWQASELLKSDARTIAVVIALTDGVQDRRMTITGIRQDDPAGYDPSLDYWRASTSLDEDFPGAYRGKLVSSNYACVAGLSTDTQMSIAISGSEILFEQSSVGIRACDFPGVVDAFEAGEIQAAGNYLCSDSTSGSWATERTVMTGADTVAVKIDMSLPGCAFDFRFVGFKE